MMCEERGPLRLQRIGCFKNHITMEKSPFFRPAAQSHHERFVVVKTSTPRQREKLRPRADLNIIPEEKSSLVGTSANLVNAIVGCGIVGIPFAVRKCGFVAGILLTIGVALCTEKSLRLLVFTAKHIHVPSYEMLAEACFGPFGFRFVSINMLLSSYGAMVSYLMVVKDCFSALLLRDNPELNTPLMRRTILLVISLGIMFPLACKRDMASLAQTSRVNVVIDTALVCIVAWNVVFVNDTHETHASVDTDTVVDVSLWVHWNTLFVGLGVLSFAFVCQHSAFIIAGSLHEPTVKRWSSVTGGSLSFCCVLALLCGISGYLGYRETTQGNILDNLDPNSTTANLARAMLGITMCFVFPLEAFVARHVCVVLLFEGQAAHQGDDAHILSRRDRRVGLTAALYILAVIPAALFNDLGPVLALTGAIGGSCLSYIGPGAVFLGVHGERFLELVKESWIGQQYNDEPIREVSTSSGQVAITVTPNHAKRARNSGETTPLVTDGDNHRSKLFATCKPLDNLARQFLWILTGMPLWTKIATIGMESLNKHVHDLALNTPYSIRIGGVEYTRAVVNTRGNETIGSRIKNITMNEQVSSSSSAGIITYSLSSQNFSRLVGNNVVVERETKRAAHNETLEEDPQKDPPLWRDFLMAIGYILLGIVAFVAGIGSLFMETDTSSS